MGFGMEGNELERMIDPSGEPPTLALVPCEKHRDDIKAKYGECCSDNWANFCFNIWCVTCNAAQTKAHLDGRKCALCDFLCACWPFDQVFSRRQLRQKYSLALDGPVAPYYCLPTYFEDCWVPCITFAINFAAPVVVNAALGHSLFWIVNCNVVLAA
eukprot:CAMPEP_0114266798 /NCGR_PEP_ID=MMETSP0058-20121206/24846_1 /TAXON_ID=36894 /ORGANISM="Pyramimonas parkeae, CCMP726" /LENGTH=156 /DNA_ID=CAMNT_0001384391 /DNA_START=159 /DNA_END=625 /DNA_ORIENTATION=+